MKEVITALVLFLALYCSIYSITSILQIAIRALAFKEGSEDKLLKIQLVLTCVFWALMYYLTH